MCVCFFFKIEKISEREREREKMEEKLIARLESAVARLESLSTGFGSRGLPAFDDDTAAASSSDPSILAFDDLISQYLGRVSSAAEKIGGQVLEVTNVLQEAFNVQKELLIKAKQTQVGHSFSQFFWYKIVKIEFS